MLFFSELKGKNVCTEDGINVGKLDDFIFKVGEKPSVNKIVVIDKKKKDLIIPIDYLKKINREVIIFKNFRTDELQQNELFILRNLLDKQIIDLKGAKIVRVNDVVFQKQGENLILTGVDISLLGILRWLKLEDFVVNLLKSLTFLKIRLVPTLLSWSDIQPLELARGIVKLKKEEKKLKNIRPEDLADYLETTTITNVKRTLDIMDKNQAIEVINNLNLNYQAALFRQYSPQKAASILSLIDPDEAADILLTLSEKRKEAILSYLSSEKKKELLSLIKFSKTPIGDLLTTEFLTVYPNNTVKEVIDKIKKQTGDFYYLNNVYVINQEKQLLGVFNLHELILQNLDTPVYKFMITNPITLHLTTPKKIALKKVIKYKISTLPVIDREKRILGIVSFDDLMEENEIK